MALKIVGRPGTTFEAVMPSQDVLDELETLGVTRLKFTPVINNVSVVFPGSVSAYEALKIREMFDRQFCGRSGWKQPPAFYEAGEDDDVPAGSIVLWGQTH